jgi:hypothetical protein
MWDRLGTFGQIDDVLASIYRDPGRLGEPRTAPDG